MNPAALQMMPRWVSATVTVGMLISGLTACHAEPPKGEPAGPGAVAASADEGTVEGLEPGQRPPDISVTDVAGKTHTLSTYAKQGDVVLLHFWATWCPYCRNEIPKLTRISEQQPEVKIVAVSVDEDAAKLREFLKQHPLPYPVVAEAEQSQPLSPRFDVQGIPASYLIDRQGLIANHFRGQADLEGAVRRMTTESAKAP